MQGGFFDRARSKQKSGIFDKAVEHIESKQNWPHLFLSEEYPGKGLTFMQLDFNLFIAGELEIITNEHISSIERQARLHLLKWLTYLHKTSDWDLVRDIYVAILNKIETGQLSWSQYHTKFQQEIQWLVTKRSLNNASKPKKAGGSKTKCQTWCCRYYNNGTCNESTDHSGEMNGSDIIWKHICLDCFQNDKVQKKHRAGAQSCPHATSSAETTSMHGSSA